MLSERFVSHAIVEWGVKAYLALIAMDQNRLVTLRDKDFQNSGNDSVGGLHSWILVRVNQDSMMSDTALLEKGLVHLRVGLIHECPVLNISTRSPE